MTIPHYTPDIDIKMHEEGAIKLICAPFKSHENGLPEWVKNSSDKYIRREFDSENRVIVLFFRDAIGKKPSIIACLDFAGMSSQVIENHFRNWADPDAAQQGCNTTGVQGGHGNGGKCYMIQMFEEYSFLHTVINGKGNRYGFVGKTVRFGYFPDHATGRDFPVTDVIEELNTALDLTGCKLSNLPIPAQQELTHSKGFTIFLGVGLKDYGRHIPVNQLIESLQEHPQMLQALHLCQVYLVANGIVLNSGKPLAIPNIQPMLGAETPREILIPEYLNDLVSGQKISTTDNGKLPTGKLILKTSNTSMKWSKKTRHSVIFLTQSGYIGFVPVLELDVQSTYRDKIYGECHCSALESFKQNERKRLAESPLTRAVERFLSFEIQKYAKEFEAKDNRKYNQEEKSVISRMNEALDKWKNRFLRDLLTGMWGNEGVGPEPPLPTKGLPWGVPYRLELSIPLKRMGRGVAARPSLKFFDKKGDRIHPVPYQWVSEDPNVAVVDEDLGILNSFSYGNTIIYAEINDGSIRSNRVSLEVVRIHDIRIAPNEIEVPVGTRRRLEAICTLSTSELASDVLLVWTESDSSVVRVTSSGLFFAARIGETEVTAGDDCVSAQKPAKIKVIEGVGRGEGNQTGKGYPKVLISGEFDRDPDTDDYRHFSSEDPPVWQDPIDVERNIWWINSSAPLAQLYLDKSQGYGHLSREWRMYHLERYIDVIFQISITCGPSDLGSMSANEWILKWGEKVAEIQAAAMIELSDFINSGNLPEF